MHSNSAWTVSRTREGSGCFRASMRGIRVLRRDCGDSSTQPATLTLRAEPSSVPLVQWLNSGTVLCVSCRSFFKIIQVCLLLYLLHVIDDVAHTRYCGEDSKGHTSNFFYAEELHMWYLQQEIRAGRPSSLRHECSFSF